MDKHTPGPWTVSAIGRQLTVATSDGVHIAIINRYADDNAQSDARLIAAAPELLAACQAALALLADPDGDAFDANRVEEQLMDAIAKAVPNA